VSLSREAKKARQAHYEEKKEAKLERRRAAAAVRLEAKQRRQHGNVAVELLAYRAVDAWQGGPQPLLTYVGEDAGEPVILGHREFWLAPPLSPSAVAPPSPPSQQSVPPAPLTTSLRRRLSSGVGPTLAASEGYSLDMQVRGVANELSPCAPPTTAHHTGTVGVCVLEQAPEDDGGGRGFPGPTPKEVQHVEEQLAEVLADVPECVRQRLQALLVEFADVFSAEEGSTLRVRPVHLDVKSPAELAVAAKRKKPFCSGYPLTEVDRQVLRPAFEDYQRLRLVKERFTPSATASPVFTTGTGSAIATHRNRVVVDFSFINWMLRDKQFPVQSFDDLVGHLRGSRWFSLLDMRGGYHQLKLDRATSDLLTMAWDGRLFRPLVLWEGVQTAPGEFQAVVTQLHKAQVGMGTLILYLDDHLVHTEGLEEHFREVRRYLTTCRRWNVKLKLAKCLFFRRELTWLGHDIAEGTIRPPESYLKALQNYGRPTQKGELQRFTGCVAWVARHFPGIGVAMGPLYRLQSASNPKAPLRWDAEAAAAWEDVRDRLASGGRHLRIPRPAQAFGLVVDASKQGWGAILLQESEEGAGDWGTVALA
jgi:hypothetical protein